MTRAPASNGLGWLRRAGTAAHAPARNLSHVLDFLCASILHRVEYALIVAHDKPVQLVPRRGAGLAQNFSARNSPQRPDDFASPDDDFDPEFEETRPSLPIILISAACGIAGGVVGLYVTYAALGSSIQVSVFVAVLGLSLGLGASGAGLSALTSSRAAVANIVFSCGLILASFLFLGLCMIVGALGATLLLTR